MGLRTAASSTINTNNSDAAKKAMAPALTEPVNHQSKISSPAQASSPRPIIISTEIEQNQSNQTTISSTSTTSSVNATPNQQLSTGQRLNGGIQFVKEKLLSLSHHQQQQQQISDFQLAFLNHSQSSNGLTNGSSSDTLHMDLVNDNLTVSSLSSDSTVNVITDDVIASNQSTNSNNNDQHQPQETNSNNQCADIIAAEIHKSLESNVVQAVVEAATEIIQQTQTMDVDQMPIVVGETNSVTQQTTIPSTSISTSNVPTTSTTNATNEIDQWSELDLMQVFKSLDASSVGENLCDLAGGLSLFNDVDIGLDDVVASSQNPSKELRTSELLAEIEKKRAKMIRECDFMMRRLRKIQSRNMGRHISEEIYGVYEYTQQMIKRKERETKSISTMTPIGQLQNDKHKMSSASSLKALLKRIDQAANIQQTTSASAIPVSVDHQVKQAMANVVPALEQHGVDLMQQCGGLLSSELQLVNRSFDSDATASSSGGESADEMITYNNPTQQPLSIARRAAYRWARDRAKIASRWTWLLAQITDLEYRIRQHHELYLMLKKHNGSVEFEDSNAIEMTAQSSTTAATVDVPSELPQQPSVNGYRGTLPGNTRTTAINVDQKTTSDVVDDDDGGEETFKAARTRPFKWNGFKKRKLLQSTNLHKISRKAARSSTIKCGCRWPVHPCMLCTGRRDPTAPRDLPDMLSTQEGVALLDPGFHPILSFPEDVPQSVHIEGILRQPEWQTKAVRTSSKAIIRGALAMQKQSEREERDRRNSETQGNTKKMSKKLSKKYNNNLVATKLKKARNNNNNQKLKKQFSQLLKNKKKSRKNSHLSSIGHDIGGSHHESAVASPNGSLSRSINASPTPGGSTTHKYERLHDKRHNKNAYDIDNIVIPYNIAAAHRVEILSYKEIPTPKWREIDDNTENGCQTKEPETELAHDSIVSTATSNGIFTTPLAPISSTTVITPDNEDVTNEAYQQRHDRALTEERKKFSTFLKFPYSTRSRANRRIDSQADSSGANTPDPMSPAPSTLTQNVTNDQESAPTTPQPVENSTDGNGDNVLFPSPAVTKGKPVPVTKAERRRTVSLRKAEEFLRRSNTPDIKETITPFEPLAFPLTTDAIDQMIDCMPASYKKIIANCIDNMPDESLTDVNQITTTPLKQSSTASTTPIKSTHKNDESFSPLVLLEDSDETESAQDEDPNDPEWREPSPRVPRL